VAKLICKNLEQPVEQHDVVLACLFHDMGNILKFDLPVFPEFTKPEGVQYWEGVKADFTKKYGPEQHAATAAIAKEISLSEPVTRYIRSIDFSKLDETLKEGTLEVKICEYADMRVGPHGLLSMEERLAEGRKRYLAHGTAKHWMAESSDRFNSLLEAARGIERDVFENATVVPGDISDVSITPLIEELWEYPVS
jgi:5'-deoxynucleotidase YfbR-like HD superfamily hydrolase